MIMKIYKKLIISAFIIVVILDASIERATAKDLKDIAIDYVKSEYHAKANKIRSISSDSKNGLIVSVENPSTHEMASYWLMFEELTPGYAGVPQPDRKWNRLNILGISPKDGPWTSTWRKKLSDDEFKALHEVQSKTDIQMNNGVVSKIIREKALPKLFREWPKGQINIRATTAQVFRFKFDTEVRKGGNLMGVVVYIDTDGTIMSRTEGVKHVD